MIVAVVKELEGIKLPSDEGHEVDLFKMHIPFWLVSDRDLVVTFYEQYDPKTGYRNYFDSSRGNEEITKKYKKLIGRDVIVDAKLNFLQFKPYDGGMEINQVIVVDLGGYLPFFCKKIVAKISAQCGRRMIDKLVKG